MSERVPLISKDDIYVAGPVSTELRIVLVGKTGSGKSSTGNTILNLQYFKTDVSPESVTKTSERHDVKIDDRIISVIDTPGLFDTRMTKPKIKNEIMKCVYMSVPGPHAFLLAIKVGRFTDEEKSAVKWIQENFGEEAACYTIILFTHADALEEKLLDEYIRESNDLKALVNECGGRFHSFNNKDRKNHFQVTELLKKIEKMVEKNGGQHYTDEMFQEAQRRILDRVQFWSEKPRIVLLGKTGSGKTRVVETILGRERRNSPNSETCEVHEANVDKKSMEIIDTPGLIDASKEKMKKEEIEKFVWMSAPGPHVFLLVIRLDTRFTDQKKNTEKWIQENIGEDAVHHTIILFTHADLLRGKSLDEYIRERPYLESLVHRCGDRSHPFNSRDRNNHKQVTELLEKIENMAEGNGWRYYTNQMFKEILNRKVRRLRNVSVAIGSAGAAAIITGGVVLGATTLVAAPALAIAGGGLAVAGAGGIAIYKKISKKD